MRCVALEDFSQLRLYIRYMEGAIKEWHEANCEASDVSCGTTRQGCAVLDLRKIAKQLS